MFRACRPSCAPPAIFRTQDCPSARALRQTSPTRRALITLPQNKRPPKTSISLGPSSSNGPPLNRTFPTNVGPKGGRPCAKKTERPKREDPGIIPGPSYCERFTGLNWGIFNPGIGHDHVLRRIPIAILVDSVVETVGVIDINLGYFKFAICCELNAIYFGHLFI